MEKNVSRNEMTQKLNHLRIPYCFNNQKYSEEKLKFIIVGDNPGEMEYKENKFFFGPSGQKLRGYFHDFDLCDNFETECIIFNKTFIHTHRTKGLESIKEKTGEHLFNIILENCAIEIAFICTKLSLPILIFGKSQLGVKLLFDAFWRKLNSEIDNKENILVFNHPSFLNFEKEWTKYKKELSYRNNLDLLKQIGKINTQKINYKYSKFA